VACHADLPIGHGIDPRTYRSNRSTSSSGTASAQGPLLQLVPVVPYRMGAYSASDIDHLFLTMNCAVFNLTPHDLVHPLIFALRIPTLRGCNINISI
jgi:hypothetical protein